MSIRITFLLSLSNSKWGKHELKYHFSYQTQRFFRLLVLPIHLFLPYTSKCYCNRLDNDYHNHPVEKRKKFWVKCLLYRVYSLNYSVTEMYRLLIILITKAQVWKSTCNLFWLRLFPHCGIHSSKLCRWKLEIQSIFQYPFLTSKLK